MAKVVDRRTFSKAVATAAAVSLAPRRVLGANDQVRLGFIGVGNRGCQLLRGFLAQSDAKVVALCDVYEPYLNAAYDRLDPRFVGLGKRIPQMPKLAERGHTRQGFPRDSRSQGHRCRRDRHSRPLARDPDDRGLQGEQGRLCREAIVDDGRRGAGHGRRGPEVRAGRSGRHASAVIADVRRACRGRAVRRRLARSRWRVPRSQATWYLRE